MLFQYARRLLLLLLLFRFWGRRKPVRVGAGWIVAVAIKPAPLS